MKMINADELIEFCNTERSMLHAHNNSVACAALRRVVEYAKEYAVEAVEAEPINNGWISVEDKMPNEGEDVLIYCPEFLEEIRKVFYTEGDFYVEKEDLIVKPAPDGYCTHWRPLPEPPKGE